MSKKNSTTIAIILGASEFPKYNSLEGSPTFLASANAFKEYLRSESGLNLPSSNIKFLFNSDEQPGIMIEEIRNFINEKVLSLSLNDVIFYYCGHGGYLTEQEYFLAVRCTAKRNKEPTCFKVKYLVNLVADLTSEKRNLVVLDACYSGGAVGEFALMSDENSAEFVAQQLWAGTILFCAAGPKKWAKTPLEATHTMFSGALLKVLEAGDPSSGPYLAPKRVAELVKSEIESAFKENAVEPQIHLPIQDRNDLLQLPYFPNSAYKEPNVEDRLTRIETSVHGIRGELSNVRNEVKTISTRLTDITIAINKSVHHSNVFRRRWDHIKRIRFGHIHYVPLLHYNQRGRPVGFGIDLLSRIIDGQFDLVKHNEKSHFGTVIEGLCKNEYEIVATPLFETFERSSSVAFTLPLFYSNIGLYANKSLVDAKNIGSLVHDNVPRFFKQNNLELLAVRGEISEKIAEKLNRLMGAKIVKLPGEDVIEESLQYIANDNNTLRLIFSETFHASTIDVVQTNSVTNILAQHQLIYPVGFALRLGDYNLRNFLNIKLLNIMLEEDGVLPMLTKTLSSEGYDDINIGDHFFTQWPVHAKQLKIKS